MPEHCPTCGQSVPHLTLAPEPAATKARSSDPSTSKAAAVAAFPRQGTQRLRVLRALALREDATNEELSILTGLPYVSVTTRVSELVRGGWVYRPGGARTTTSGGDAALVRLTDRARDELKTNRRTAA